jgi:dTMP kinase
MNKAYFIVFEGLDGSGKTTQLNLLSKRLADLGRIHIRTREPSDNNLVGKLARSSVSGGAVLENETLALLFAADRYQHAATEILPALKTGNDVLCDRYYYSNFAFQGDMTTFARLSHYNEQAIHLAKPDLTLFIDVRPEECLRRIREERPGAAGMYENLPNLTKARERYLEIFAALRWTDEIVTVKADGLSASETEEQVWDHVKNFF